MSVSGLGADVFKGKFRVSKGRCAVIGTPVLIGR